MERFARRRAAGVCTLNPSGGVSTVSPAPKGGGERGPAGARSAPLVGRAPAPAIGTAQVRAVGVERRGRLGQDGPERDGREVGLAEHRPDDGRNDVGDEGAHDRAEGRPMITATARSTTLPREIRRGRRSLPGKVSAVSSEPTGGRPGPRRFDFQVQKARNPCRCQRTTVWPNQAQGIAPARPAAAIARPRRADQACRTAAAWSASAGGRVVAEAGDSRATDGRAISWRRGPSTTVRAGWAT